MKLRDEIIEVLHDDRGGGMLPYWIGRAVEMRRFDRELWWKFWKRAVTLGALFKTLHELFNEGVLERHTRLDDCGSARIYYALHDNN